MNLSRNWLAQYVNTGSDIQELCRKLTMAGIEVESVETKSIVPPGIVVAKILERQPHPNSDHLSVCRVFNGKEEVQIVCGAPNCDAGKTVPLATIGTVFHSEEGDFTIKKSKLRGVESFGMMCSGKELGLSDDHDGLLILPDEWEAGTPLDACYPGDTFLEVEVTPNRPDWLSHWGVARDISCLLNTPARLPEVQLPENQTAAPADLVTVEDAGLCPRYIGRVIENVTIKESPEWLKERLISIGLRPINNVVDVTNFVMMELGQPLHAFDRELLEGGRVVARRARAGEKITLLNGREIELTGEHLVIADAVKPMALAGVMGGEASGVREETRTILLESAVFDKTNIRTTSRRLGVSTDASYRYERGVDYDMADLASDRAAQLILETAGGTLGAKLERGGNRPEEPVIPCRFDRIRSLIGIELDNDGIVDIFRKLGLKVDTVTAEGCTVTAPLFRLDLTREADLAEEIARINGLDAVPARPVVGKVVASIREDAHVTRQQLRDELIGFGLYECMHYSMVSRNSALSDTRFEESDIVKLSNPLSSELEMLRPSLFGEMLGSVERNISRRNLDLRLFEIGRVFCANPEKYPEERFECCIALTGRKYPDRYSDDLAQCFDFYDLKGLVEGWLEKRRITGFRFEPCDDARFAPGCCAELKLNRRTAGHLGMLAPGLTAGWRTGYPVFVAQIDIEALLAAKTASELYQPLSQFPATSRDIAFVADASLKHADVVDFIRKANMKNLESVKIFDLFLDDKAVGAGKKSMAYTLTFRHAERTLTDQEVNGAVEKLREKLAAQLGVELR
ncbi:MAG: phenylalanine--tRNA ligase subunit beta [Lentisphaeria bacterium]|nr:phenylalanine--tRNA ligase subunit beta [Lentisphaeria bacterium]